MKNIIGLLALVFATALSNAALAVNCSALPFTLTNGSTADATQVMSNFNALLTCSNTSLAHNAANSDITSLTGLTTPLSTAQGGTGNASGNVPGNAATATTLATGRTLAITGDLTWTSPTFNGSANVTAAGTLAASGVGAGTYGDGTHVFQGAVDAKGRVTAGSSVAISTMVGDSGSGGAAGFVPAPATGDATHFLRGDATYVAIPSAFVAWADVGTTSSSAFVNKGFNVSSVTRLSSGRFSVSFTSTVADGNYAVTIGVIGASGGPNTVCTVLLGTKGTGGFTMACQFGNASQNSGLTDPAEFMFQVVD